MADLAWKEVEQAVAHEPLLCCAHNFHAYTLPVYGLCISFHCCVRHELSVEEAHQLTVRLEKELRERLPLLGRILIHLEPPAQGLPRWTSKWDKSKRQEDAWTFSCLLLP